jgi:hypothetical protein
MISLKRLRLRRLLRGAWHVVDGSAGTLLLGAVCAAKERAFGLDTVAYDLAAAV